MKVRMPNKMFKAGGTHELPGKVGSMLLGKAEGLGVATKLWAVAIALALPVLALLYFLIAEQNIRVDFGAKEVVGMEYLLPMTDVLKYAQQARGFTQGVLASHNGSGLQQDQKAQLAVAQKNLQAAMLPLQEKEEQFGGMLGTEAAYNLLNQKMQEASGKGLSLSSEDSFALYNNFIQDGIMGLIQTAGNNSNLILDPDIDSYYMMDAVIFKVPEVMEHLGQLRGSISAILAKGEITIAERAKLETLQSLARQSLVNLENGRKFAIAFNPSMEERITPLYQALQKEMEVFFQTVNVEIILADFMTASPEYLFEAGTKALGAATALTAGDGEMLVDLLNIRIEGFKGNRLLSVITVGLALLVTFAGLVLIIRQITSSLTSIGHATDQISTGDLTVEVPVSSKDEFGQLGQSFNRTIDQIGALLKEARDVAEQVSLNSNEMMFSSDRMVTGVQEQNTEAAKVAIAIQGVVDSIYQVSETAAGAALAAQRALETSQLGDEAVRESLEGMNRIRNDVQSLSKKIKGLGDRSLEIYEIVTTIQEIASQTNLLALNAAIEAAGAGEAGLRFGVVADDVRKLAERSSQATKDIAGLIKNVQTEIQDAVVSMEQGTAEVERDYQITVRAGENLKAIAEVSRESAALSQDISRATNSQVEGAQNVAIAVQSIAKVAEQTEEGVQMTRQTMAELSRLAVQLAESLGRFKLAT